MQYIVWHTAVKHGAFGSMAKQYKLIQCSMCLKIMISVMHLWHVLWLNAVWGNKVEDRFDRRPSVRQNTTLLSQVVSSSVV